MLATLEQIDPDDVRRWGGKACSLARLHQRGLPVPPAFALSTRALDAHLRHNDLRDVARHLGRVPEENALELLRQGILNGRLPPEIAGRVRAHHVGERLAVRSSAAEEDGVDRSFAGQFLTVVNVRPGDALEDAIKACWASLYSREAAAYRKRSGQRIGGMAVVVQRLVDARASGALFTVNPVTGSWSEMVVEAVLGQGEALVAGHVRAERSLLSRPRRLPRGLSRLVSRARVQVRDIDRVPQDRRLTPIHAGELTWVDTRAPEADKLSEGELRRLGRLGLRAERLAGSPQDLEWAIDQRGELHLLQSRPITAKGEPTRGEGVLWSRRFVGERWEHLASPLGWSITSELLTWFIDYPETSARYLGGGPPLRLLRGRPYVNVTVFRHLAFKLPGRPPPGFMMDFLPPDELQRWTRRFAHPPDARVYRSIFATTFRERRWRRFRWNPFGNHRAWDAFRDRLERELPLLETPPATPDEALRRVEHGIELWRDYIKVHITSLLFANLSFQILGPFLPNDLRDDLLRAPAHNPTLTTNRALWQLGRGELDLDAFLAEYGHRTSGSSWELFSTRWHEQPEHVERLAASLADLPDPDVAAEHQSRRSDRALAELRRRNTGLDRLTIVEATLLARRYLELREEQRFVFDRLLAALKARALDLGGELLDEGDDIRWLEWLEVRELAAGRLDAPLELIERRRRQWAEHAAAVDPPTFLIGDEGIEVPDTGRSLSGLGISAGRATGTVRILRTLEDGSRLRAGEILVARATDPGWTPLFLLASAVVLELGSMLSHGAVVAREYGLPAVVNVPGALTALRDGQTVTVDGTRGVVWIDNGGPDAR
ncbi:MAG: hypothetical protein GY913_10845 [Proteobacteria bacterium]|nr:hypothetical protein [Pseudomonadota bacterium]MCP4917410.1 hypothetical protein [Pseudomonadota bacterium]